jgi:integrase
LNPLPFELKGINIAEFQKFLLLHVREVTAHSYCKRLKVLMKLGDVNNPDRIKTLICTYNVSETRKELLTNAYDYYVQFKGLRWIKPRFTRDDVPIFLPLESELDALIANTRIKMSTYLQLLKETGADAGEAWKLRWIDINVTSRTVAISPTKNHNTRTLTISENLLSRLLRLPRENSLVFAGKNLDKFRWLYETARNKLAKKLDNPRIHEIMFKTFRHWKATHEYYRTKDILHVKYILGHKRIENTLIYTHLVHFESDEFVCKVAKTIEEATALVEAGYEFVTSMDGIKLFKKRK